MASPKYSQINGIYETHLPVADLPRSIAFYRDRLGLELAREIPGRGIAFFWVGGKTRGMLGLWATGSGPLSMTLHFAFAMDLADVLAAAENLKRQGIQPLGFEGEPVDEPVVLGWMPAVSQYFKDPDGHSLEFIALLDEMPDASFKVQPYSVWAARD